MKKIFPALLKNDAIKELCGKDILRSRFSHAYIIDGPDGSGKHTAAMQIAMSILCENKDSQNMPLPCGACPSCKKAAAGFSTCIEYVNRGSNSTLQVDVIRKMISGVCYQPEDGDYKIYIIEDADRMTAAAQNSLLLTLEEPPAHAVFILLTADSGALLETVRSRATILKTEMLSSPFVFKTLEELADMGRMSQCSAAKMKLAAAASAGCLGRAIQLCSASDSSPELKLRSTGTSLADTLLFESSTEALLFCRGLDVKRGDCETLFYYAIATVRDYIALKSGSDAAIACADIEESRAKANKTSVAKLMSLYNQLESASDDIIRRNASVNTVLCTLAASTGR